MSNLSIATLDSQKRLVQADPKDVLLPQQKQAEEKFAEAVDRIKESLPELPNAAELLIEERTKLLRAIQTANASDNRVRFCNIAELIVQAGYGAFRQWVPATVVMGGATLFAATPFAIAGGIVGAATVFAGIHLLYNWRRQLLGLGESNSQDQHQLFNLREFAATVASSASIGLVLRPLLAVQNIRSISMGAISGSAQSVLAQLVTNTIKPTPTEEGSSQTASLALGALTGAVVGAAGAKIGSLQLNSARTGQLMRISGLEVLDKGIDLGIALGVTAATHGGAISEEDLIREFSSTVVSSAAGKWSTTAGLRKLRWTDSPGTSAELLRRLNLHEVPLSAEHSRIINSYWSHSWYGHFVSLRAQIILKTKWHSRQTFSSESPGASEWSYAKREIKQLGLLLLMKPSPSKKDVVWGTQLLQKAGVSLSDSENLFLASRLPLSLRRYLFNIRTKTPPKLSLEPMLDSIAAAQTRPTEPKPVLHSRVLICHRCVDGDLCSAQDSAKTTSALNRGAIAGPDIAVEFGGIGNVDHAPDFNLLGVDSGWKNGNFYVCLPGHFKTLQELTKAVSGPRPHILTLRQLFSPDEPLSLFDEHGYRSASERLLELVLIDGMARGAVSLEERHI